jgi:hypothetical protein
MFAFVKSAADEHTPGLTIKVANSPALAVIQQREGQYALFMFLFFTGKGFHDLSRCLIAGVGRGRFMFWHFANMTREQAAELGEMEAKAEGLPWSADTFDRVVGLVGTNAGAIRTCFQSSDPEGECLVHFDWIGGIIPPRRCSRNVDR